jgi:adenylate cyclase
MVFIGDPVAVDKPAEKAVSLALAMREAALDLSAKWKKRGVDLGLAIGIDQGFATVGSIGFEDRVDYAAIGTVTNLACRLCQHARAGEVLLSQRVYSEVEAIVEAEDLGDVQLHGFSRAIHVYRCAGRSKREADVG